MANTRTLIGDRETVDGLVSNTLTSLEEDSISSLGEYVLANRTALTGVNFPNLVSAGGHSMSGCTGLTSLTAPNLQAIGQYTFQNCTGLTSVSFPSCTSVRDYAFAGCTGLTSVSLPACTSLGTYAFRGCSSLASLELPAGVSAIPAGCFAGTGLTSLTLGSTSMVTLSDTGAFSGTPIEALNGVVYVPADLVDTYKADSVWKNFWIASAADYPFPGSPQSLRWAEVNAASLDGTYTDKYPVGTVIPLTSGQYIFFMELIAQDTDDLADESGKAHMTWLSRDIAVTGKMTSSGETGSGYTSSLGYTTVANIKSNIDPVIQGYMKSVTKTWSQHSTGSTQSSAETFWIPSAREVGGGSSYEDSGCSYSKFSTQASRKKYNTGTTEANAWWLRSAASSAIYAYITNMGQMYSTGVAGTDRGIVPGFCI